MIKRYRTATATAVATALLVGGAGTALASSHGEGPFIKTRPQLDATDFYAFVSYEPGREDYVTLIANYQPLQDAYGGPNYFPLDPEAIYEIHVDNDGDAMEDITFLFDFSSGLRNEQQGLALQIGDKMVPVPLKNIGPLGTGDNRSVLNVNDTFVVGTVRGDRRSASPEWASRPESGERIFAKPFDNIGQKSIPVGYENYASSVTNSGRVYYDVEFAQCPEGKREARVFAGQRKDSFSIALGEIFDLVNFVPLAEATPDDPARDDLADKNVTTLAVEVHKDCLTGEGNGVIGAWTTSSVRATQTLGAMPSYQRPISPSGRFQQVSRLGSPLVNEVVIGLPDKNLFNASEPKDDGQFATYVTNPTLPALIDALFREPLGAPGNIAPSNLPRTDLVTAFLTGFAGVNQLSQVTASEMLRLNTGIAPTAKEAQVNLGVVAGDLAGFPNGRRPGDDITDIALRVVMGALCYPIAVDLDANGTVGDAGDNLGLCRPEDAPVGNAALTDGAPQNAGQFDDAFPYLTAPLPGSPSMANDGSMTGDMGTGGMGTGDMDAGGDMGAGDMDTGDMGAGDMDAGDMDAGDMDDMADAGDMAMDDASDCPVPTDALSGSSLSSTEAELLWDAPPGGPFGYDVYIDNSFLQTTDRPGFLADGLEPGTSYEFDVVPFDGEGNRYDCLDPITLTTQG